MLRILFVGNFLSKHRGTKGIAERIAERSSEFSGVTLTLTSYHNNKILRLLDVAYHTLCTPYTTVVIDVYSGAYFFMVRIATCMATARRKKVILNLRGGKLHELEQQRPAVVKRVMARAASIITPSLFLKDMLGKKGYSITYLPNFIDNDKFPYLRIARPNSLLWVRAFATIYNPQMAIRVLAAVHRQIPDATLTMVGPDRGELQQCNRLIEQLGLQPYVTIVGKVDNRELPAFYHQHTVYLNTTAYESFGLAVLEAASCGIPVVSNRVGELPYLWKENEEMLLCDPDSVEEMAGKVLTLLKNTAMAEQISLRAHAKAQQFGWHQVKPQWQKLMTAYA